MPTKYAGVAELADALDLGSSALRRGGSTPFTRTIRVSSFWFQGFGAFFVSGIIFLKKVLRCISHFNTFYFPLRYNYIFKIVRTLPMAQTLLYTFYLYDKTSQVYACNIQ